MHNAHSGIQTARMYVNCKLSPVQLRFRFAPDGFLWFHLYITVIIVINEASSSRADSEIIGNPYTRPIFAGSVSASSNFVRIYYISLLWIQHGRTCQY